MPSPFISDNISFISSADRRLIVDQIVDEHWPHIRAKGYYIIVKPYVRPVKTGEIMLPESVRMEDVHHSVAAQVIDIGPTAYIDPEVCGGVSWAEIGDWVFVPRAVGARIGLKNADGSDTIFRIVTASDIIAAIKDPAEWEIRINATKY